MWSTGGAGVGLGVEAPIGWVLILDLTCRTHCEDAHCCLFAVIGHVLNDSEARAAVGAIDKGIIVASVMYVEEFAQAIIADGAIR
ncbi:hypothetical protein KSX_07560 [Ktedonospora formicarum]|uniref:Uncharacterized protein n=1 Tax=Ktedonospora formicarum TaxID=2778364 RepID=A0A8J3HXB3_9CHLR|nr:hypothetical protein KSX_07560 [Ktedonospora formicarum]